MIASIKKVLHDSIELGLLASVMGATLFSFKPVLIKLVYQYDVDSLTVLIWRMLFTLPIYLGIGVVASLKSNMLKLRTGDVLYAGIVGLIGYYLAALFDLYGLLYVSAQLERVVLFTYPAMVTLLGLWFLGNQLKRFTLAALFVSYVGISFIFLHDLENYGENVITGSIWVLLAALSFSAYVLLSKPIINRMGSVLFTCIAMTTASLAIFVHHMLSKGVSLVMPSQPQAFYLIFIIATFCTLAPSFMVSMAIHRIGPVQTSIVGMIGPIMTSLFAVLLIGESFTLYHLLGIVLILGAILLEVIPKDKMAG